MKQSIFTNRQNDRGPFYIWKDY